MASQNRFALTPTVSISRSKFKRSSQHKTTIKIGEITPIYLDEVLPGDTRSIDMAGLVRMITPVVPIMDNIHMDYYAFFCPNRLLWTHWREFMGENNSSAGIYQGTEYKIPTTDICKQSTGISRPDCLGAHLGLPIGIGPLGPEPGKKLEVSALPGRMYHIIYNEWFRDQNLIAPITVSLGDDGSNFNYGRELLKAAKDSDYFTRSLPYAQKGAPVTIPMGTSAEVKLKNFSTTPGTESYRPWAVVSLNGGDLTTEERLGSNRDGELYANDNSADAVFDFNGGVIADLSSATAATINQLRFAFQYQKLLERDALYGTRYWEILKGHFGVSAPDASLQRPELLGHFRSNVNIDQVLQTTGSDIEDPQSNTLGNTGAVSVTGCKGHLCSKSFTEHGYIMILAVARHDQTYGQGVSRDWTRSTRTDFYFPEFANLGAQAVKNKEIFVQGTEEDEGIFGYQEAWAEYRYKPSIVSGYLKPNISSGLGFWTLANNFDELPTLSKSFIEQNDANINRSTDGNLIGFHFICDFAFRDIAVRPMPLYSTPGLIDHH